jgi:hypothetical protein
MPARVIMTVSLGFLATLLALAGLLPQGATQGNRVALKLENASSFEIRAIYFSSSADGKWGADRLGDDILYPGYTLTLAGLRHGRYRMRLVDEDGDSCVIPETGLFENKAWRITNGWLLGCEFHASRPHRVSSP